MNKAYYVIFISLFSIILLSGCTIPNIFGGDVLSIQDSVQVVGFQDVLEIKDIQIYPKSPLLPDMETGLLFVVHNKDNIKIATDVKAKLFDAVNFKNPASGRECNLDECKPILGICSFDSPCSVLPGEEKLVQIDIKAPSLNEIANVRQESNLQFKAEYDFKASMIYDAVVINMDELKRRQRSGETLNIERKTIVGSGPVQIGIELYNSPYILAGKEAVFIFNIKNHGDKMKGNLKGSVIPKGRMNITFPGGLLTENSNIDTPTASTSQDEPIGTGELTAAGMATAPINLLIKINFPAKKPDEINYELTKIFYTGYPTGTQYYSAGNGTLKKLTDIYQPYGEGNYYVIPDIIPDTTYEIKLTADGCDDTTREADVKRDTQYIEFTMNCNSDSGTGTSGTGGTGGTGSTGGTGGTSGTGGTGSSGTTGATQVPLFECHRALNQSGSDMICTNLKDIELYSGESRPLYFRVSNTTEIEGTPYRTFIIKTEAGYTYELRDSITIQVNPYGK